MAVQVRWTPQNYDSAGRALLSEPYRQRAYTSGQTAWENDRQYDSDTFRPQAYSPSPAPSQLEAILFRRQMAERNLLFQSLGLATSGGLLGLLMGIFNKKPWAGLAWGVAAGAGTAFVAGTLAIQAINAKFREDWLEVTGQTP